MNILGLYRHHNASACLLKDGEILFHLEEERITRKKYDSEPILVMDKVFDYLKYPDKLDHMVISGICKLPEPEPRCYPTYVSHYDKISRVAHEFQNNEFKWQDWPHNHHEMHCALAFYNSGFDKAVVIVADGGGSVRPDGSCEIESIFIAEYPAKFTKIVDSYYNVENISCGWKFEKIATYLGFQDFDAGKIMGLSSYGKPNPNVPDLSNNFLFTIDAIQEDKLSPPGKSFVMPPGTNLPRNFQNDADLAYELQTKTQKHILSLIEKGIEMTGIENVCVVGGYGLNCVANYYYRKNLPQNINLYVEPVSMDGGISIGAAKYMWHYLTNDITVRPIKTLYLGPKPSYDFKLQAGESMQDANYSDVIDLIIDGKIVALFQGSSEAGPRALGNRTLMFDPRIKDGKDIVNTVKGREHFRPFAGSCLEECVHDWFDMAGMKNSPYMMYAVDVLPEKIKLIPSIVHVDNTCRVQTVTKEQNKHWYNLISEFNSRTGVPILFNTSFNLAGEPLVENMNDALRTLRKSKLEYLYLPEIGKLITIKNG
jgi:carbamoyltransferase